MEVSPDKSFLRSLIAPALVLLLSFGSVAQTVPATETSAEKAKRGEALFHEASSLYKKNTPAAFAAAAAKFGEARVIFQQVGDKEREGYCLTWLGGASAQLGAKATAIDYFKQALKLYEALSDRPAQAEIHVSIAHVYSELEEPPFALEHFNAALKIYSSLGSKAEAIDTLKVIGKVHYRKGDTQKAIASNEQALALARTYGDKNREFQVLANIGNLHFLADDFDKAFFRFEEMLALARANKNRTVEVQALVLMGTAYRRNGDVSKTVAILADALRVAKELGDKKTEAAVLNDLAEANLRNSALDAALKFANEALQISIVDKNQAGEGAALLLIGVVRARNREHDAALETLKTATVLLDANEDLEKSALARMVVGGVHLERGEAKQSLAASLEALSLSKMAGSKEIEVEAANNVGGAFFEMGEYKKALEYYEIARPIARELDLKQTEARILLNIGNVLRVFGNNAAALENFAKAGKAFSNIGDKVSLAKSIIAIGGIYLDLGEVRKALENYQQALLIAIEGMEGKNTKESRSIYLDLGATAMNNLGRVYSAMSESTLALDYYTKSLRALRELQDKNRESITLSNIADIHSQRGETEKASELLYQGLRLVKETGNIGQEATILNSIAAAYSAAGDKERAIEYYGQSLFLLKHVSDPRKESITLGNMLSVYGVSGQHRVAIFYGKLAVGKVQRLRGMIRTFDRQTQKTYLAQTEFLYRQLADLLIRENRADEAQQVLNAFKDEQYFDTERPDAKELRPIVFTPREANLSAQLDAATSDSGKGQIVDLERQRTEFTKLLKNWETELSGTADVRDLIGEQVRDVIEMRAVLAELEKQTGQRAAAIYTLVGDDTFHALIVVRDAIRTISVPVKGEILNARAKTFWALLQSDRYDPKAAGKELYDTIFRPMERELPAGVKTILWSLDGNLRYVPVAALFDGKQYLAERYDTINFTRADRERLTRPVTPKWTATGMGTSKEHAVDLLGSIKRFVALPGVREELGMLISRPKNRGIFEGDVYQDEKFTRTAMLDALKAKRPVVHISTHFSFTPGDDTRSFLLMGDGSAFTLADMKKQKDMFAGVELLTLSACNTAAQHADANGREVDAFFELAQRSGAKSVMATLWPVADNSTPWLMREFYELKVNKKQNKAEALRNSQLALLRGSAKATRSTVRNDASRVNIIVAGDSTKVAETRADHFIIEKKDAKPYVADPARPFAHPFYWSPFVLIGNWR